MLRVFTPVVILALVCAAATAQEAGPTGFAPAKAMTAFQAAHGPGLRVQWDPNRGVPAFISGGQMALVVDGSDASYEQAARSVVDELAGAVGYGADALQLDQVHRLALSRIGSSDKVVVKFRQRAAGVMVFGGFVNVLFSADGKLLSVDNGGLPHAAQVDSLPSRSQGEAAAVAMAAFVRDTGLPAARVKFDDYVLYPAPVAPGKQAVRAEPAFLFVIAAPWNAADGDLPVVRELAVAARGEARVLDSWSKVHAADLTGTVQGWGQPGLLPDGQDPATLQTMKDVRIKASGLPAVFSDGSGQFDVPGAAGDTSVTATLNGQFARVVNSTGANASITQIVTPGIPSGFTFNAGLTQQQTAEVNAHLSVEAMRDWVKGIDPTDTTLDFQVLANVNLSSTCNAFFDGFSINFFLSGGGCVNTAYSTVVWHEEGHWANSLYGSGNGSDGFGEGAADVWAMYIANDPVVGAGFSGPGTFIRTGLNTRPFCGDANPGCYGEVHNDGEVLMGALWKVRANIQNTLGDAAGGDVADLLMLSWFQVFNDGQIKSVIENHWLVLDDDDGNINNGTPHLSDIDAGFVAQGFPGFVPPLFNITHTPITLVGNEGPVTITANVTEVNGTLSTVSLHHSFDGGATFISSPMTLVSGDTWSGTIPGVVSPATVDYYIQASEASGSSNFLPAKAPATFFSYDVGSLAVVSFNDFEGPGDEGWTHMQIATQDDWQHGTPAGKSTDPSSAFSGTRVWGNDLGPTGFNGEYQPNVHNVLASPRFDLSGVTNTRLRFKRWLGVEDALFDQATLKLNGIQIWQNVATPGGITHTIDTSWTSQDFDISALADNNASVQVSFDLMSDGGLEFGGWTIDDFAIVSLGPVGSPFVSYGTGTPGFGGQAPVLAGNGSASPGGTVTLDVSQAVPNSPGGALFVGTTQASVPALGGTFLVGNVLLEVSLTTSALGTAHVAGFIPNNPALVGIQLTQQYWTLDPSGPQGKAATNGVAYTIQ